MKKITLKVNEKDIPLNEIMSNMLTNILTAFVNTLKKIPEDMSDIQVHIEF
jgi:hypothetical protein